MREDPPFEVSSADLNRRFGEIRRRVGEGPVAVTYHGRRALMIVTTEAFERMSGLDQASGSAEQERRRLAVALDYVSEGYVQLGRDWRVTESNRTAQLFVGRTREEFLGRTIPETFPTVEFDLEPLVRAMDFGETVRIERASSIHPERMMAITAYPLPGTDGGIGTIFANVSERSRMLATIKSRSMVINHLVAEFPDRLIFVVNDLGQVDNWGPGAERALGWTKEIVGQPLASILATDQPAPAASDEPQTIAFAAKDGRKVIATGSVRSLGSDTANVFIMIPDVLP